MLFPTIMQVPFVIAWILHDNLNVIHNVCENIGHAVDNCAYFDVPMHEKLTLNLFC